MKKKAEVFFRIILLTGPALLMIFPILFLLSGSITSPQELKTALNPEKGISWKLLPHYPVLDHFGKVLLYSVCNRE